MSCAGAPGSAASPDMSAVSSQRPDSQSVGEASAVPGSVVSVSGRITDDAIRAAISGSGAWSCNQLARLSRLSIVRAAEANVVMLHFLDLGKEWFHCGEEIGECRTAAKSLFVALDRIPFDTNDEVLGLLDAAADLIPLTMRIGIERRAALAVCLLEFGRPLGGHCVSDVLHNHLGSLVSIQCSIVLH